MESMTFVSTGRLEANRFGHRLIGSKTKSLFSPVRYIKNTINIDFVGFLSKRPRCQMVASKRPGP